MSDIIKFSIIVPVYNVEKYLNQCVDSVLGQSYKEFELILVNDGSSDGSSKICDSYEQADNRVRVIHKENGGLSSARNAGIILANGEYVIFLDSDDYWDDLGALNDIAAITDKTNVDVIIFGYKKRYDSTGKIDLPPGFPMLEDGKTKAEILSLLISHSIYKASACDKVVRRDLIIRNDLFFEEGVLSEDVEWCAVLAVHSENFALYKNAFYVYRQRVGSITKSATEKSVTDMIKHFIFCYELANNLKDDILCNVVMSYAAVQFANMLITIGMSENISKHLRCISRYSSVLDFATTGRAILVNRVRKIIGLRFTILALSFANKFLKLFINR